MSFKKFHCFAVTELKGGQNLLLFAEQCARISWHSQLCLPISPRDFSRFRSVNAQRGGRNSTIVILMEESRPPALAMATVEQGHSHSIPQLSPLSRGHPIQAGLGGSCYSLWSPFSSQPPLWWRLPHWREPPSVPPSPGKGSERWGGVNALQSPLPTCDLWLSNSWKLQGTVSTFDSHRLYYPLIPQSRARFVILKIGHIFALQKQLSLRLSSQELSSSRHTDFFFFSWQKNIWPSSGQKRGGFIAFSPHSQHAVALLGW